jgi:trans-aconitate 2-methyltransferase
MNKAQVIDYYDNFVEYQNISKVNDRIYALYKRAKSHGLNSYSNVLELGSGIGVMTYLLLKTVKKGTIESVEISPKSVAFAKSKIKNKNINFFVDDVVSYKPELKSIDIITLFDVIEHIPKEKHFELFKNISSYMNEGSVLLINIPNPEYIEFDINHQPEVLQIIDQPIHLDFLLPNLETNDLCISLLQKHSIWVKNDYVFYAIEKKKEFKEIKIHDSRTFIQKVMIKLFRMKLKMLYK